jgi:hypothetical protein
MGSHTYKDALQDKAKEIAFQAITNAEGGVSAGQGGESLRCVWYLLYVNLTPSKRTWPPALMSKFTGVHHATWAAATNVGMI